MKRVEYKKNKRIHKMKRNKIISKRIKDLCKKANISYYQLSYKSAVPITTLMNIIDCNTKNPGIYTLMKICDGLEISLAEFFDTKEFEKNYTKQK